MKPFFILFLATFSFNAFSQQQMGNVFASANSNISIQTIQTNGLSNTDNLSNDNNDDNPIAQQQLFNLDENFSNIAQTSNISKPVSNAIKSNGNKINLTLDFSSRSSSSASSSSSKKTHKHTFHKKLIKFNRKLYGKMTLHKKSKHLVDVCFNWSK